MFKNLIKWRGVCSLIICLIDVTTKLSGMRNIWPSKPFNKPEAIWFHCKVQSFGKFPCWVVGRRYYQFKCLGTNVQIHLSPTSKNMPRTSVTFALKKPSIIGCIILHSMFAQRLSIQITNYTDLYYIWMFTKKIFVLQTRGMPSFLPLYNIFSSNLQHPISCKPIIQESFDQLLIRPGVLPMFFTM